MPRISLSRLCPQVQRIINGTSQLLRTREDLVDVARRAQASRAQRAQRDQRDRGAPQARSRVSKTRGVCRPLRDAGTQPPFCHT